MIDDLQRAIHALQSNNEKQEQDAFAKIYRLIHQEPKECAAELSAALVNQLAKGDLHTPRLLTLLGLTREPLPDCALLCRDLLHSQLTASSLLPTDALLGAAAIISKTNPRYLLPDINTLKTGRESDIQMAQTQVEVLEMLLLLSNDVLLHNSDNLISDMLRWIWYDCTLFDLMTLGDIFFKKIEYFGWEAPIVELFLDLIVGIPVEDNPKSYVGGLLQEAGIPEKAEQRQKLAWRAVRVAPPQDPITGKILSIEDPQPPTPETRIDEALVMFTVSDGYNIELARVIIDEMFGDGRARPPAALSWWVAVTVDALPASRRRDDIRWALAQIGATLRRFGADLVQVPPSLLQKWLDTPQLLDEIGIMSTLDLLSRQHPEIVIPKYLYRAVLASDINYPEVMMGDCWQALAEYNPEALLAVVSRWIDFGFDMNDFSYMLMDILLKRVSTKPTLIQSMKNNIASVDGMSETALDIAHDLIKYLEEHSGED